MTAVSSALTSANVSTGLATAPVLEFRCLYTHDVRRKAKRWQDGYLRFHTFNKRIMVYDIPRNLIGSLHWQEGQMIQEGDEVKLDIGVHVEVAELVGTTETDITSIVQRKATAVNAETGRSYASRVREPTVPRENNRIEPSQSRHKPLTAVLGTPKGRLGRAMLPSKSPYEVRHQVSEQWEIGRERKRQRIGNVRVDRETSNLLSPLPRQDGSHTRESILRPNPMKLNSPKQTAIQAAKQGREIVDLSSDPDCDIFSDITLPGTPPKKVAIGHARKESQAKATRQPPPKRLLRARTPSPPPAKAIPEFKEPIDRSPEKRHQEPVQGREHTGRKMQPKSIRLTTGRNRKILLCETLSKSRNMASKKSKAETKTARETSVTDNHHKEPGSDRIGSGSSASREGEIVDQRKQKMPSQITANGPINDLDDNIFANVATQMITVNHLGGGQQNECANGLNTIPPPPGNIGLCENGPPPFDFGNIPDASAARPFRRVRSENDRQTLLPRNADCTTKEIKSNMQWEQVVHQRQCLKPLRQLQRSKSLITTHSILHSRETGNPLPNVAYPPVDATPAKDNDVGPWSSEAFDLFEWRPPGMTATVTS